MNRLISVWYIFIDFKLSISDCVNHTSTYTKCLLCLSILLQNLNSRLQYSSYGPYIFSVAFFLSVYSFLTFSWRSILLENNYSAGYRIRRLTILLFCDDKPSLYEPLVSWYASSTSTFRILTMLDSRSSPSYYVRYK